MSVDKIPDRTPVPHGSADGPVRGALLPTVRPGLPMAASLERALETGKLLGDVLRCPVPRRAETRTSTCRALGECSCGRRVPILITVRWGREPGILRAVMCGEHCPDCGAVLAPATVTYLGISGPGRPFVPATAFDPWQVGPMTTNGLRGTGRLHPEGNP
jgi:hypothetical protein